MAQFIWHRHAGQPWPVRDGQDSMKGSYLGPRFDHDSVEAFLPETPAVSGGAEPGGLVPGNIYS